jgi:hypothetical protein
VLQPPPFPAGPPGYERLESDVDWDSRYVELVPPEHVFTFEELGAGPTPPGAFSDVAITTPFRFLGEDGVRILGDVCAELEQYSRSSRRIPKFNRGGAYRSRFLWGMTHDPGLLDFMRGLAGAELEPHPVTHHGVHLNFAPEDIELTVDQWHTDSTSFDYVLAATDPRQVSGGRFVYFRGSVEEGRALLDRGEELPADRLVRPELPGPGWAILQQGHRILHRTSRLDAPGRLGTLVVSFYTADPRLPDPTEAKLRNLRLGDGDEIGLVEGARCAALAAGIRLLRLARQADFSSSPNELQEALRAAIEPVQAAVDEFDLPLDYETVADPARQGAAGFLSEFDADGAARRPDARADRR